MGSFLNLRCYNPSLMLYYLLQFTDEDEDDKAESWTGDRDNILALPEVKCQTSTKPMCC